MSCKKINMEKNLKIDFNKFLDISNVDKDAKSTIKSMGFLERSLGCSYEDCLEESSGELLIDERNRLALFKSFSLFNGSFDEFLLEKPIDSGFLGDFHFFKYLPYFNLS